MALIYPARFIMKCDDDTFVNVPNLIHYLLGGVIPAYSAATNYREDLIKESEKSSESLDRITNYKELLVGFELIQSEPHRDTSIR